MQILVAGVRQRNAPIAVREQFALTDSEVEGALRVLRSYPAIGECAVLTTCNRTEIYAVVSQTDAGIDAIRAFFKEVKGVDFDLYRLSVFSLLHEDAIIHLFRVASGLDSLILGEGQILGQVKDAIAQAQRLETSGRILDRLFQAAITVGKRVRSETGIATKDVSVSQAAYELARKLEPDLLNRRIALIGGGKMATLLMNTLKHGMSPQQQARVTIVNRSETRLKALIEKYGYRGVDWEQINEVIAEAEVLFVATGAPHTVLRASQFEDRGGKLVMDISVPRNVDPKVGELPGIRLYNTDDLEGVSSFSPEHEALLQTQAQRIIEEEYSRFYHWYTSLPVIPTIAGLKSKVEEIRQAQLAALGAVSENDVARLDAMSRTLVNKIFHEPLVRLRLGTTREEMANKAAVLSQLFNIQQVNGQVLGALDPGQDSSF